MLMGSKLWTPVVARFTTAETLDIRHVKRFAFGIMNDGSGKPADRNKTFQFRSARRKSNDCHGVLRAIANEEFSAGWMEYERVRRGPKQVAGFLPRPDRLDDFISPGVDDAQSITGGICHDEIAVICHTRQMDRDQLLQLATQNFYCLLRGLRFGGSAFAFLGEDVVKDLGFGIVKPGF